MAPEQPSYEQTPKEMESDRTRESQRSLKSLSYIDTPHGFWLTEARTGWVDPRRYPVKAAHLKNTSNENIGAIMLVWLPSGTTAVVTTQNPLMVHKIVAAISEGDSLEKYTGTTVLPINEGESDEDLWTRAVATVDQALAEKYPQPPSTA